MYRIIPPDSRFVENTTEPVTLNESTQHMRYVIRWALFELNYQSQRITIPLSAGHPVDFLRFMNEQLAPSLIAIYNLIPNLSDMPSGNKSEDSYQRQKIRRDFVQSFEHFLALTHQLSVSVPSTINSKHPLPTGLTQQVVKDLLDPWRQFFEQVLSLTDNIQHIAQHADANGTMNIHLKADLPESYQTLTKWLQAQIRYQTTGTTNEQPATEIEVTFGQKLLTFTIMMTLLAIFFWAFYGHLVVILLIAMVLTIIWFFIKNPFALLGALIGISMGS